MRCPFFLHNSEQDYLGAGGLYFLFGSLAVLSVACIYATVPETKGKTLEEIEDLFE